MRPYREKGAKYFIAARMTSPLAYPCINIEAAWCKVYNLQKMERTKERYKNKEMELKIS